MTEKVFKYQLGNHLGKQLLTEICKVDLLLRNLEYDNNTIQNQNVFQPIERNALGDGSVNIEFSNELILLAYRKQNGAQ